MWTLAGFVYTAFCVDVYSRRILGWRVMTTKTTPLVHGVLEQALFTRRRADFHFTSTGLVHHSDAGSQYTSLAFTEALVESGIACSIGSVGDALDNALMESTIGLCKTELIDRAQSWSGRGEVERETAEWVRWSRYAGDLGVSAGSSYRAGGPSNREVRDVRSLPGPQRVCRRP